MNGLIKTSTLFLKRHSPTILSFLGAAGVIGTAVMAVKATPKAIRLLDYEKSKYNFDEDITFSKKETIQITWKCYIPTALVGLSTIGCIFGANVLNKRNQATLMSIYAMLNESYKKYRNSANNVFGEDADKKIKVEMAKDAYVHDYGYLLYSLDTDPAEKILCYDWFSERYFRTTMAAVLNAEYHINRNLAMRCYATVNEFYTFLGIDTIENGDEIGWQIDELLDGGLMWLDFNNEFTNMNDGMECCIISSLWGPPSKINFEKYN